MSDRMNIQFLYDELNEFSQKQSECIEQANKLYIADMPIKQQRNNYKRNSSRSYHQNYHRNNDDNSNNNHTTGSTTSNTASTNTNNNGNTTQTYNSLNVPLLTSSVSMSGATRTYLINPPDNSRNTTNNNPPSQHQCYRAFESYMNTQKHQ